MVINVFNFQVNDQEFLDLIPVDKVEFIKFLFRAWKSKQKFQMEPECSNISMEERKEIEREYAGLVMVMMVLTLYDFVTCKSTE